MTEKESLSPFLISGKTRAAGFDQARIDRVNTIPGMCAR